MPVRAANSISAIAALIKLAQAPRASDQSDDTPYFGSPSHAPAGSTAPAAAPQEPVKVSGLDFAAANLPQPTCACAAGIAAYAETSSD